MWWAVLLVVVLVVTEAVPSFFGGILVAVTIVNCFRGQNAETVPPIKGDNRAAVVSVVGNIASENRPHLPSTPPRPRPTPCACRSQLTTGNRCCGTC